MYNVRIFHYEGGTQYRLYKRPVFKSEIEDDFLKECGEIDTMLFDDFNEPDTERSNYVSLNRTKQNLIGLCRSNSWHWFVTFTFNSAYVCRSNYEEVCKKTCKWLNNLKNRKAPDLKYVLVPELHKDGENYHCHGLLANCQGLEFVNSGKKTKDGDIIYNMPSWQYGFNTATMVFDTVRVSYYISKYLNKDLHNIIKGKRRFWNSRNCLSMTNVSEEYFVEDIKEFYQNITSDCKFIKKIDLPDIEQAITYIEV
ncbi:MAG: hypothetical protein Q4B70_05830 [Lachnospiraceae bacterium]|nr:hypothetical protein [Lachnospiraceae bacterium]